MHKIKYFPDVALLLLRLVTGISIIITIYPMMAYIASNGMADVGMTDLIQALVFLVASVLLMLGLFTRWTTTVLVLAIIITSFQSIPPISEFTFSLVLRIIYFEIGSILVPLSIWLMGAGKYALDYKIWKRS